MSLTVEQRHAMDAHLRASTRYDWPTHLNNNNAIYCSRAYLIDCLERVLRDDRRTTAPVRDLVLPHAFILARDVPLFWHRLLALTALMADPCEAPHVMVCAGRHILTWPTARLCLYTKTLLHDGALPPEPRWFARRLPPAGVPPTGGSRPPTTTTTSDDDDDSGAETESESVSFF
jgi:hypothetical protein